MFRSYAIQVFLFSFCLFHSGCATIFLSPYFGYREVPIGPRLHRQPIYCSGVLCYESSSSSLKGVDLNNRKCLWAIMKAEDEIYDELRSNNESIFASYTSWNSNIRGIIRLDPRTGQVVWRYQERSDYPLEILGVSQKTVVVLVRTGEKVFILQGHDSNSGLIDWSITMKGRENYRFFVFDEALIGLSTLDVFLVNIDNGARKWDYLSSETISDAQLTTQGLLVDMPSKRVLLALNNGTVIDTFPSMATCSRPMSRRGDYALEKIADSGFRCVKLPGDGPIFSATCVPPDHFECRSDVLVLHWQESGLLVVPADNGLSWIDPDAQFPLLIWESFDHLCWTPEGLIVLDSNDALFILEKKNGYRPIEMQIHEN